MEKLVQQLAHSEIYHYGSAEYYQLNEMSDSDLEELTDGLIKLGYSLTYNNNDDCFCVA